MKMARLIIQLPQPLREKLKAEQKRGTSAAGLIRHLLEQHFKGNFKGEKALSPPSWRDVVDVAKP